MFQRFSEENFQLENKKSATFLLVSFAKSVFFSEKLLVGLGLPSADSTARCVASYEQPGWSMFNFYREISWPILKILKMFLIVSFFKSALWLKFGVYGVYERSVDSTTRWREISQIAGCYFFNFFAQYRNLCLKNRGCFSCAVCRKCFTWWLILGFSPSRANLDRPRMPKKL